METAWSPLTRMIPIPELLMAVAMAAMVSELLSFSIFSSDLACFGQSINNP